MLPLQHRKPAAWTSTLARDEHQQLHRRRSTAASARRCRSRPGPRPPAAARPPSASVAPSGEAAASLRRRRACSGSRRGAQQAAVAVRLDDRARWSNSQRIRHRALLPPPRSSNVRAPNPSGRGSCSEFISRAWTRTRSAHGEIAQMVQGSSFARCRRPQRDRRACRSRGGEGRLRAGLGPCDACLSALSCGLRSISHGREPRLSREVGKEPGSDSVIARRLEVL